MYYSRYEYTARSVDHKSLGCKKVGDVIRKIRKDRQLRLEDLADSNISPSTISKIERGESHNSEKVGLLLDKLGLDPTQLTALISDKQAEEMEIELKLDAIETMLASGNLEQAFNEIKKAEKQENYSKAVIAYLKGRYFIKNSDWKKAERNFGDSIRLQREVHHSEESRRNLSASSFNELSIISYFENNLDEAIKYTDSGLEVFDEDGERKHDKYILMSNKAIYLEKAGRIEESFNLVDDLWSHRSEINSIEVILSLYELRSILLRRKKQFDDAIHFAKEGIKIARLNNQYNRLFDLWSALGSAYLHSNELKCAKICFQTALTLEGKFKYRNVFIQTYTDLGILYVQEENWSEATKALNKAISLGRELNDARRLSLALIVLGDLFAKQDKKPEAISYYKEAIGIVQKHQLKKREHAALIRLAQCLQNTDQEAFATCAAHIVQLELELQDQKEEYYDEI